MLCLGHAGRLMERIDPQDRPRPPSVAFQQVDHAPPIRLVSPSVRGYIVLGLAQSRARRQRAISFASAANPACMVRRLEFGNQGAGRHRVSGETRDLSSKWVMGRAKKINQAWGSNPESRPVAYLIGKSRLTIGPTRLIVVHLLTPTSNPASFLAHPHKGAKNLRGCAALSLLLFAPLRAYSSFSLLSAILLTASRCIPTGSRMRLVLSSFPRSRTWIKIATLNPRSLDTSQATRRAYIAKRREPSKPFPG
jgi:hypothetical protein